MRERWGGGDGEGKGEGGGGREGEGHRDAGRTQRGQSTPVSTCSFFSPSPVSWGRTVSVPPREVWSSFHLNPLPVPRKAGHPSACCLGDAGDAIAVVAGRAGAASFCITGNARPRSASCLTGLSPARDPRCLPQGPPNSRSGGSTGEHGGSPPNTS